MPRFLVRSGSLDWCGIADDMRQAIYEAIVDDDCDERAVLGEIVEVVQVPDEGPTYFHTENTLRELGIETRRIASAR